MECFWVTGQGGVADVLLGGRCSLHVVEAELLPHVAVGHLTKRVLVVLHELEDGRQLFFLNSVEKKGERGKRCFSPRAASGAGPLLFHASLRLLSRIRRK